MNDKEGLDLARIEEVLGYSRRDSRLRAAIPLSVANDELKEWLSDDRQWAAAYTRQWISLLDDVSGACGATGSALNAHFTAGHEELWSELADCRASLSRQGGRGIPDLAIRRRLERVSNQLTELLADPNAREAAWQDLLDADSYEAARSRARTLFVLISSQGVNAVHLLRDVQGILRDDRATIDMARGATPPAGEKLRKPAGLPEKDRLALVKTELLKPPRTADSVYWLEYALAPMEADPAIQIGEAVTLYSPDWLEGRLSIGPYEDLPVELRSQDGRHHLGTFGQGPKHDDAEKVPRALVRVALGEVRLAEAEDLARETAELLVSLATLYGADPSIWILTDSYISFVSDKPSGASFSAPPVFAPTFDQDTAMREDRTSQEISEWAERLAQHLPLRNPELRRAAQLALWQRRTRQTWEPGRLVLCDRVFEQVAGWAGLSDRGRFIHDYLRLSWALYRVHREITNCWHGVFEARSSFFKQPDISDEAWREIQDDPALDLDLVDEGWRINLRGVLRRIDFLLDKLPAGTPAHERLKRLASRTASGKRTAAWIDENLKHFEVLEGRARRIRNSLVHGGPVNDETAEAILPFVEWLAADALHTGIEGFLSAAGVIDHFLDRREAQNNCLARLRRGDSPADALFWK